MAIDPSALAPGVAATLRKAIAPATAVKPVRTPEEIAAAFRAAAEAEAKLLANEIALNKATCLWCSDPAKVAGECFCTRMACDLPDCPALDGPMSTARQPIPTFPPKDN